jgi:hypothetical protein
MSRLTSSDRPYTNPARGQRLEMIMPRLTQSQMLAILRESGVPESDARRWIEHDPALAGDTSSDG